MSPAQVIAVILAAQQDADRCDFCPGTLVRTETETDTGWVHGRCTRCGEPS